MLKYAIKQVNPSSQNKTETFLTKKKYIQKQMSLLFT